MNSNLSHVPVKPTKPSSGANKLIFFLAALLFPLLHTVSQAVVSVVAVLIGQTQALGVLGATASSEEVSEYAQTWVSAHSNLISLISNGVALLILIVFVLLLRPYLFPEKKSFRDVFALKRVKWYQVLLSALMAFFFYHVVILLLGVIGMLFPSLLESYVQDSSNLVAEEGAIIRFLALVILAPVVEELVYRVLSINTMKKAVPSFVAVLVMALVFGLAHGNFLWILYAAALGVVFGFLYARSESVFLSLAAHMTFNLLGFLYSFVPEEATETVSVVMTLVAFLGIVAMPLLLFVLLYRPKQKTLLASHTHGAMDPTAMPTQEATPDYSMNSTQSAWVYDPASACYYDPRTTWYYNPVTKLYYYPPTGQYYDPATGQFFASPPYGTPTSPNPSSNPSAPSDGGPTRGDPNK